MASHKSIKRVLSRIIEEVKATKMIADATSWRSALVTIIAKLDIQMMNRNGYQETAAVKSRLLKKHEVMLEYFQKSFADFLGTYTCDCGETDLPTDRIWVCWWQGVDQAPLLVKKCIESIARNAGDHEVVIITEENYREYANIPKWVEEKFAKGIISKTHYSDILRLSLLAEHGGMWLDSTFFCAEPMLDQYFQMPLWSIKRPDYLHGSVACGKFATYSLSCSKENRWIFAVIKDFVLHYWKENDILIDYLFLDYLFVLAQKWDKRIDEAFLAVEPNNPSCDELCKVLGQPFSAEQWNKFKADTCLFKLTWKQDYPASAANQDTYYAKLLRGELCS